MNVQRIQSRLARFSAARGWDRFHNAKNLSMALAGEAGELLEHFQWLSAEESGRLTKAEKEAVALEIADITIYALRLSAVLGIDLERAIAKKMKLNARKYPAALQKGRIAKRKERR